VVSKTQDCVKHRENFNLVIVTQQHCSSVARQKGRQVTITANKVRDYRKG